MEPSLSSATIKQQRKINKQSEKGVNVANVLYLFFQPQNGFLWDSFLSQEPL